MTTTTTGSAPTTKVDASDHLAAAAYLMKHYATSTLVVVNCGSRIRPEATISAADLAAAAARGIDLERTRVGQLVCKLTARY
jgi:hypothetical protein